MSKRHTDIDPFNAGEPILPWCDPDSFDDDSGFDIEDENESTPHEYPGSSSSSSASSRSSSRTSSKRSASKRPKASARSAWSSLDLNKPAKSSRKTKKAKALSSSDQPVSTRNRTRPVLIGILVLFLLSGGFSFVARIPGCIAGTFSSFFSSSGSSLEDDLEDVLPGGAPEAPNYSAEDLSEAENACLDATTSRMELLTTPGTTEYQQATTLIADDFNQACEDYLYYSADELGLNGETVATWLIGSLDYQMSSVHAFPNDTPPYGSAYLDVTVADPLGLYDSFFTPASNYLMEQDLLGYDDEPGPSDEVRRHLGGMLQDAIDSSTETAQPFVRFELVYANGTWSISETEYVSELEFIFGM